jgi:anti-anti-sigma regulatory factor
VQFSTASSRTATDDYVIAFEGRLGRSDANRFKALLFELIDVGARSITVDLTRTHTVDETAVGILIIADKTLRLNGGSFHVVAGGAHLDAQSLLGKRGNDGTSSTR